MILFVGKSVVCRGGRDISSVLSASHGGLCTAGFREKIFLECSNVVVGGIGDAGVGGGVGGGTGVKD